jgi:flagellar protein FliS
MSISTDTYRTINLETANPRQIIVKLYEAAIACLAEAESLLARGETAEEPLSKARRIVGGLMTALNFQAGDLAKNLFAVYLFVLERVQGSSIERRDSGLADARQALTTLKSAWEEVSPAEARISGERNALKG